MTTTTPVRGLIEKLPWWLDPRLPMGRTDYFWTGFGLGCATFLVSVLISITIAGVISWFGFAEFNAQMSYIFGEGKATGRSFIKCWVPCIGPWCCLTSAVPRQRNGTQPSSGCWKVHVLQMPSMRVSAMTVIYMIAMIVLWLSPNKIEPARCAPVV